jgi:hypothetical protein
LLSLPRSIIGRTLVFSIGYEVSNHILRSHPARWLACPLQPHCRPGTGRSRSVSAASAGRWA